MTPTWRTRSASGCAARKILYGRSKRVQVVLSEAALRVLVTTPETMAGQLDKLLAVLPAACGRAGRDRVQPADARLFDRRVPGVRR